MLLGICIITAAVLYADLVPWRGDRDERAWPGRVKHDRDGIRWVPVEETPIPQDEWSPTRGIA